MSKVVPIRGKFENAKAFLMYVADRVNASDSVAVFTFDNETDDLPMGFGQINCRQSHLALAGAECLKIAATDPND